MQRRRRSCCTEQEQQEAPELELLLFRERVASSYFSGILARCGEEATETSLRRNGVVFMT